MTRSPTTTTTVPPVPVPDPASGPSPAPAPDGGVQAPATPGGDEQGNRVPATFTVAGRGVTPPAITVPPFLGIELRLTSGDGAAHRLTLRTATPVTLTVPATGTLTRRIDGQPAGTYLIDVDATAGAGTLRVADDAGP